MVSRLLTATMTAGLLVASRRTMHNWGATKAECYRRLPGDEFVPDPAVVVTRAVTVNAPASEVWRWLVQIGQNRGGMYSYDSVENLLGLEIHSTDEIRPEWQELHVGDEVRLVRRGWFGAAEGLALPVVRLDEGESLVLMEQPWHAVWSFHVHSRGPDRCRLISRSRSPRARGITRMIGELFDPVTFVMTRKMLLGIKARAERSVGDAERTRTGAPDRVRS